MSNKQMYPAFVQLNREEYLISLAKANPSASVLFNFFLLKMDKLNFDYKLSPLPRAARKELSEEKQKLINGFKSLFLENKDENIRNFVFVKVTLLRMYLDRHESGLRNYIDRKKISKKILKPFLLLIVAVIVLLFVVVILFLLFLPLLFLLSFVLLCSLLIL